MSQETFQMICSMNLKTMETQLVLQCAPVMLGVKISNLFMVPTAWSKEVELFFQKLPLSILRLYQTQKKCAFLVYRPNLLSEYLKRDEIKNLMREFGYEDMELEEMAERFQQRYEQSMQETGEYPHEIGIFLGYPVEDVRGFIENCGRDFVYSGYWKVYGDAARAIRQFKQFDAAKETGIQLLNRGYHICEIITSDRRKKD